MLFLVHHITRGPSLMALLLLSFFFCFGDLSSAQPYNTRNYEDPNTIAVREMRDTLEDIRHEVNNHESEIRMFDEKFKSLELIIESLRDQLSDASRVQKEQLKGSSNTLEGKITSLETTSKGLVADLKQFKSHANDTSTALAQYKQKIGELEKVIEQQNQNLEHLQAAMRSLMDALQVKDSTSSKATAESSKVVSESSDSTGRTYRVKTGDSLEKIARANQTTVQALKELNGLSNDKIVVGKVLQLPEK